MQSINKPLFNEDMIWASNPGSPTDVIRPDQDKFSSGFVYGEIPLHSMFNWAGNTFSTYAVHSCKYGVPEWDAGTTYTEGSLTLRDNGSTRILYIALETSTGEDPLSSTKWREFYKNLADIRDVVLDNLQGNDILYQDIITDENDPLLETYAKVFRNKSKYDILGLDDLQNVFGKNQSSAILYHVNTVEVGDAWIKKPFGLMTPFLFLNDYLDVSEPSPTEGDILTWDGSFWSGDQSNPFVEWEDVLFKPQYFNPPSTTSTKLGGFRSKLENRNELTMWSAPLPIANKPLNLTASTTRTDGSFLEWDTPLDNGNPINFYTIYREGEYLADTQNLTDPLITEFLDITGEKHKIYEYTVYATNTSGMSLPSNTAFGLKTDILPAPLNFTASDDISSRFVLCTWDKVVGATSYHLYRKPVGAPDADYEYIAGGVVSPYRHLTDAGTEFDYAVTASNPIGESAKSISDKGSTKVDSGTKYFETNGNFYVPNGIYEIEVCMTGAGGSGSIGDADNLHSGGGYSGEFKRETISVNPGEMIAIQIGAGGTPSDYTTLSDGVDGEDTIITLPNGTTITALGGKGGLATSDSYAGNGRQINSPCSGTIFTDGMHSNRPRYISCYGGQASYFGHGGSRSGQVPGKGAGGSAISVYEQPYDNPYFCNGGDGLVVIKWDIVDLDSLSEEQKYQEELLSELDIGFGINNSKYTGLIK